MPRGSQQEKQTEQAVWVHCVVALQQYRTELRNCTEAQAPMLPEFELPDPDLGDPLLINSLFTGVQGQLVQLAVQGAREEQQRLADLG